MAVLSVSNAHLAYGHVALLDGAAFALERGERVGLIGRNGSGKSSLLKVVAGEERLDEGLLQTTQGLRIRYVPQEPAFDPGATVFEAVAEGVDEARALRRRYEEHAAGEDLDALQTRIEAQDAWNWEQRVDTTLARLGLDGSRSIEALSGGQKKKVALARALVAVPDVLLLDEPTNHLDLDAIGWLEELLQTFAGAAMVVTHDRAFLDHVATRILELDRGVLRSYPGNYAAYERQKDEELAAEALARARADKLLAQEEAWVRQGVEARRTRSVARVERLQRLRTARRERREALGQVRLELDSGVPSGKIVAELRDVTFRYADDAAPVVRDFSATILRGDKVGLIGPNGAGKTTLLKLLLGELAPSAGRVRLGTRLQVAYFDQLRSALDLDATLADAVSPGSEWVEIRGAKRHVMSYLSDFLFAPERAHSPVRTLSGGERNRVLLARLFALPANVLVLDEPTNDLDIETLELLEELLQNHEGTLFLVSHDRRFLDNVVTSTIAFEGAGRWREYEGGYEDWRVQRERAEALQAGAARALAGTGESIVKGASLKAPARRALAAAAAGAAADDATTAPPATSSPPAAAAAAKGARPRKLSYKEQRELDALPDRIEALEAEQKDLGERLSDPALYADEPARAAEAQARYEQIEAELMDALERWEALASRGEGAA